MGKEVINMSLVGTLELHNDLQGTSIEDEEKLSKVTEDFNAMASATLELLACMHIVQDAYNKNALDEDALKIIAEIANKAERRLSTLNYAKFNVKLGPIKGD
jgi:hypothetical protein